MTPERTQVNVRLRKEAAESLRQDSQRYRRSVQSILDTIVENFFAQWGARERERMYAKEPAKIKGRPISK